MKINDSLQVPSQEQKNATSEKLMKVFSVEEESRKNDSGATSMDSKKSTDCIICGGYGSVVFKGFYICESCINYIKTKCDA
ncbi:MAG: hypothetical protein ACOX4U_00825 [Anaerovoracaceae bacterium]|jgi:ribosomal protein S14